MDNVISFNKKTKLALPPLDRHMDTLKELGKDAVCIVSIVLSEDDEKNCLFASGEVDRHKLNFILDKVKHGVILGPD